MRLKVHRSVVDDAIATQIAKGDALLSQEIRSDEQLKAISNDRTTWHEFNLALLQKYFEDDAVVDNYIGRSAGVWAVGGGPPPLQEKIEELHGSIRGKLRRLRSLRDQLELYDSPDEAIAYSLPSTPRPGMPGKGIFIVHGRDGSLRESVARYVLTVTGREPLILHETQSLGSETIIEKLERVARDTGFAIVLLTGDDLGAVQSDAPDSLRPRARQNVVLELGYFFGLLGRGRVVALYETGVELPSDAKGILYVSADGDGWKVELARVLKAAGIDVDLNKTI
jgi:predicted nucleotide-binding protein